MKKRKHNNQTNLISLVAYAVVGVVLWILAAALMAWLISTDHLGEPMAMKISPIAQGVIAYSITIISLFAGREKGAIAAWTSVAYLAAQFIVVLLFWGLNFRGIFGGVMAVSCGTVLALLTYKLKSGPKRINKYMKLSR